MANQDVDPTLFEIASQLQAAKEQLPRAKMLLGILGEAKEDTSEVRALILETETRIFQWEKILQRRGITLPATEEVEESE